MIKVFWINVCVLLGIFFTANGTGCSRNVKIENMKPEQFKVSKRHPFSVNVKVTGQMGLSSPRGKKDEVDHEKITLVIKQSIIESGLFAKLAPEQEADYLLEVVVFKSNIVGIPTATITTVVPMNWMLMNRNPRRSVYQVRTENKVSINARDQFGSANRYSSANEISVNKSIQQAIHELSLLEL